MNNKKPLSVTDINELIKNVITMNMKDKIYIEGEISNLKKSGEHAYFNLKDNNSIINVVYWKCGMNLENINNGDIVIINGKVTFFTKSGSYQLSVNTIEKNGIGDINLKYKKMKDDFQDKLYFSKKRELPSKIRNIGILTAIDGAGLQDIIYVLKNNNFIGNVFIKNTFVQGKLCPSSVRENIEYFNKNYDNIDVLIIARGGGSMEDLMGYSTEEVVKSIYESNIFTISAIGHEIDFMLSDFASDIRAPTPSIAGEIIIKCQKKEHEIINKIDKLQSLEHNILSKINELENKLYKLQNQLYYHNPKNIIECKIKQIEEYAKILKEKINNNINNYYHELEKLKNKNNMFDTKQITKNKYSIIIDDNDNIIDNIIDFKKNMKNIKIIFNDGEISLNEFINQSLSLS